MVEGQAILEAFKGALGCPLCGELFTKPHSFGTCGHTFCYDCVIETLEGPGISKSQCPTCGQPGWKKDLVFNHTVNNTVERTRELLAAATAAKAAPHAGQRKKQRPRQSGDAQRGSGAAAATVAAVADPVLAAAAPGGRRSRDSNSSMGPPGPSVVFSRRPKQSSKMVSREAVPEPEPATAAAEEVERQERVSQAAPSAGPLQPALPARAAGVEGQVQQGVACPLDKPPHVASAAAAAAAAAGDWQEQGGQELHSPELAMGATPLTPDGFGEDWVRKMLALPTPSPALVERLLREVALLDDALRMCDELPCCDDQSAGDSDEGASQQAAAAAALVAEPAAAGAAVPSLHAPAFQQEEQQAAAAAAAMAGGEPLPSQDAPASPARGGLGAVREEDAAPALVLPDSQELLTLSYPLSDGSPAAQQQGEQRSEYEVPDSPDASLGCQGGPDINHKGSAATVPAGAAVAEAPSWMGGEQQQAALAFDPTSADRVSGRKRRKGPFGRTVPSSPPSSHAAALADNQAVTVAASEADKRLQQFPAADAASPARLPSQPAQPPQHGMPLNAEKAAVLPLPLVAISDSEEEEEDGGLQPQLAQPLVPQQQGAAVEEVEAAPKGGIEGPAAVGGPQQEPPWQRAHAAQQPGWGKWRKAENLVDVLSGRPQQVRARGQPAQVPQPPPPQQQQQPLPSAPQQQQQQQQEPALGSHVRVKWEEGWFVGRLASYRPATGEHYIVYEDGDRQWHRLAEEEWEVLEQQGQPAADPYCLLGTQPASAMASDSEGGDCEAADGVAGAGPAESSGASGLASSQQQQSSLGQSGATSSQPTLGAARWQQKQHGGAGRRPPHQPVMDSSDDEGPTCKHQMAGPAPRLVAGGWGAASAAAAPFASAAPGNQPAAPAAAPAPAVPAEPAAGVQQTGVPASAPAGDDAPAAAAAAAAMLGTQDVAGMLVSLAAGESGAFGLPLHSARSGGSYSSRPPRPPNRLSSAARVGNAAELDSCARQTVQGKSEREQEHEGFPPPPPPQQQQQGQQAHGRRQHDPLLVLPPAAGAAAAAAAAQEPEGGGRGEDGSPSRERDGESDGHIHFLAELFAEVDGSTAGAGEAAQAPSGGGSAPPKVLVLATAGSELQGKVNACIARLRGQGKVTQAPKVDARTTHVLVPTDDHGIVRNRSMKFMQGVVRGCWVVSYAWVDACMQAGAWVPEKNFEAKGDLTGLHGPTKGRLQRATGGPGLFEGVTALVQAGSNTNGQDLAVLLEAGGAKVLSRLPPAKDLGRVKLLVPGNGPKALKDARELKTKTSRPVLKWEWVFDSVSHWERQKEAGYVYK